MKDLLETLVGARVIDPTTKRALEGATIASYRIMAVRRQRRTSGGSGIASPIVVTLCHLPTGTYRHYGPRRAIGVLFGE